MVEMITYIFIFGGEIALYPVIKMNIKHISSKLQSAQYTEY